MASPNVVDVTDAEFMKVVVEGSQERPVLVDFWAEWCGPCKQLGPTLEQVVDELGGRVLLAKVDIDKNQGVAGQLGIQSIPAVFLFAGGRPVDRFVGAQPKEAILEFLTPHLPAEPEPEAPSELDEAEQALHAGDREKAREELDKIEAGGEHETRRVALSGRLDLLELLDEATAADGGDDAEKDARYVAALKAASENLFEDALESLLTLVSEDRAWRDEAPRKAMLKVFEVVGIRSPLADAYRDRLSRLLY